MRAPLPADEDGRLARLRSLALLDTPPEPLFDSLTQLAASVCRVPIALISLIDADRQWFKACIGLPGVGQTPRDQAFCAHAILGDALLEVPDALQDPRFADNPLVLGDPHIRFYAGMPLRMPDGERLGTLCVLDRVPRRLDAAQRAQLETLATSVVQALLMRERVLSGALAARRSLDEEFAVLAENSPIGVFRVDAQGRFIYTNPAWQRICGMSFAQSLGDGWRQAMHPDEREAALARWEQRSGTEDAFSGTYRILRPDGAVRQIRASVLAVFDADGQRKGFVGVMEDDTERIEAARGLRAKSQLLDRAGRMAGVGGWEIDLPDGRPIWSDETCRIHDRPPGYRPTLEEGIDYYAPAAREVIARLVRDGLERGAPWDVELPLITATGRHIWVRAQGEAEFDAQGRPVRLFGAFQDITARREAETRLRELYEKTPAMLQSLTIDGVLTSVSDLWLTRTGFTREQVLGRKAADFVTHASREAAKPRMIEDMRLHGEVRNVPLQMWCADGSIMDFLYSMRMQSDADGQPAYLLGILEDVTEAVARRAELERERSLRAQVQDQAADLARLADERREMLDVLAHEVRQPLNNASAALQSAFGMLGTHDEGAAGERLQRAHDVIGDIARGLDNTLAAAALLASGRRIAVQDSDIETLLQTAIGDLPPSARGRVQVLREGGSRTVAMDSTLMRLALRNLLGNALRHSAPETAVELRVIDSDEPLGLVFEVADSGVGVADSVRAHLFERGRRGPGSPGHGLGLYIVRRVMELHGGRAELVHSEHGRTVFRLLLVPLE